MASLICLCSISLVFVVGWQFAHLWNPNSNLPSYSWDWWERNEREDDTPRRTPDPFYQRYRSQRLQCSSRNFQYSAGIATWLCRLYCLTAIAAAQEHVIFYKLLNLICQIIFHSISSLECISRNFLYSAGIATWLCRLNCLTAIAAAQEHVIFYKLLNLICQIIFHSISSLECISRNFL